MTQPSGGDSFPVTGLGKATAARSEQPVAIVGMACRFPGAANVPAFWRRLEEGLSSVVEGVPGSGQGRVGELFPDSMVQSEACRFGAYLDDLTRFDAAFFRISPVEAQLLDPQQRLMLETSWRALEDAGMDPDRLRGSRTGVYAGISNYDYRGLILDATDTAEPAPSLYSVTGTSFNTAIGRVAYVLGLHGPAIAVDTACSLLAGGRSPGSGRAAAGRGGYGARRRGPHDPVRTPPGTARQRRDAGAGRPVQDLRRGRRRLREGRRVRDAGHQAARGCRG